MDLSERQVTIGEVSLERMVRAVEKVRDRLLRAAKALEAAKIPYAVAGGNAVAAWVARVDEAAVRNTQDVDILLRRGDLEAAKAAMAKAGFVYRHVKSIDMFMDGPDAKARDAVHVVFAKEKVRSDYLLPAPEVTEAEATPNFRLLKLEALVAMKLTSFRLKDRVHLLDMIDVGLVDPSWLNRFPAALSARLKELLDNPEG
jgi:putative nucleotidyltransferase-like protein